MVQLYRFSNKKRLDKMIGDGVGVVWVLVVGGWVVGIVVYWWVAAVEGWEE